MAREGIDKLYYKIGDASELTGVPISTLRFWESQFAILSPRRNKAGTRFYTPSDIEHIRMIRYMLHDKGMRIEAAQEALKSNPSGTDTNYRVVARLKAVRTELKAILDVLHTLR